MHRPLFALAAGAVLALAVSGCADERSAVPAGVAAQYATLEKEIADEGGTTVDGPWRVGYIVEAAEPWYENHHGHESFRPPQTGETNHVEIIPMERSTGRIVPDAPVTLAVLDSSGTVVEQKPLSFYYSDFFHYADNFALPKSGDYTLRATIEAPTFNRHGEKSENPPLAHGTTVTFDDVHIDTSE